ncbi:MAG: patatin-like phospholipase family protein [Bacteroidota bacterium]
MRSKILILTVIFSFLRFFTFSQEKVGLVLSGGGAKGLAHIGVIKALEENNIPVDYVTGTSMGAIVGGLYAIGYSPEEMTELVLSDEFRNWAVGEIERDYIYYFKKSPVAADMVNIKIHMKDSTPKAQLPSNLVPTHQMDFAAMQIFSPANAAADYDFDSLFVPFRCIGTDIYNNKAKVFKEGNLGSAVRASMTFPFYFKPVEIDSILYFDGGMKNNFPSDVMIKDFDPGFIIGSKTADNSPKPDADNVVVLLENMLMDKVNYQLPDNGILIESKFINVKLLDFDKAQMIIKKGYDETYALMDSIKNIITIRKDSVLLANERKNYKHKLPPLFFKDISISGLNSKEREYVSKTIFSKDSVFTIGELKHSYFKLLADGTISSIYPEAFYDKESESFKLKMQIDEESRFIARIGANISSSSINQGFGSFQYNQLGKISRSVYANIYFGRLYSSVMLQARADFPSRIPVAFTGSFTMNRWDFYSSSSDPFFEDVRPPYLIQNENNLKLAVSTPVNTNSLVKGEFSYGFITDEYYQTIEFLKADTNDLTDFDYYNYKINFEENTLNYKQFPTRGVNQTLSFNYLKGTENFVPGSTSAIQDEIQQKHEWFNIQFFRDEYLRLNKHFHLGYFVQASYSTIDFFSNYTATMLNANVFQPTPHSKTMFLENYRAHSFMALGIKPILKLSDNLHLRAEAYAMFPYQRIISGQNKQAEYAAKYEHMSYMGSTTLVYHTLFGPASLSLNYYDKNDKKFYFVFNFGYLLFNKRGYE